MRQIEELLKSKQVIVDEALEKYLQWRVPEKLWESMAYSTLNGGKRLRSILVLAATEIVGGNPEDALPIACAVELIHTQSLIHDDLPVMDNDDWRRGKLSNHRVFGEAIAIVAGDSLLCYAFQIIAQAIRAHIPNQCLLNVIAEIAHSAGGEGMCGGQVLDIQIDGRECLTAADLEQVYRLKTGCLIRGAIRSGAMLGGASPIELEHLTVYAEQIGLAFQIVDDILDITGTFETLGKTPGKDIKIAKQTYPQLFGIERSREIAQASVDRAIHSLQYFGDKAFFLQKLAEYMLDRQR